MFKRFLAGGEGLALPASSTYEAFINQLKIVCKRTEAQSYIQNPKITAVILPHIKPTDV